MNGASEKLLLYIDAVLKSLYAFDRSKVLNSIASQVRQLFNCEAVSLFLIDENDPSYILLTANDADRTPKQSPSEIRLKVQSVKGASYTGHIADKGEIVRAHGHDLQSNPYVRDKMATFLSSGECLSSMTIPLKDRKGRLIGLLKANNKKNASRMVERNSGFTDEDQNVAELLADRVVVLLEIRRAFDVFRGLTEDVHAAKNLDETLQTILIHAKSLFRADRASIALWSQAKEELVMGKSYERGGNETVSARSLAKWATIPKNSLIFKLWERKPTGNKEENLDDPHGDIVLIPDVHNENDYYECDPEMQSELAIRLRAYGRPVGVLNLESVSIGGFDELDKEPLRIFSQNASIAIQPMRESSWLQSELSLPLPAEEVLNVILENALELYNLDAGIIFFADHAAEKLKCVAYRDTRKVADDFHDFSYCFSENSAATEILKSKKPLFFSSIGNNATFATKGLEFFDIDDGPFAGWPLVFENVVVGVLVVWNRDHHPGPTEEHIDWLRPFARLAAAHIARQESPKKAKGLLTELDKINRIAGGKAYKLLHLRYLRLIWIGIQAAGFDRARVFHYDQDSHFFHYLASYGVDEPNEHPGFKFHADSSEYARDVERFVHRPTARIYDPTDPTLYGPDPLARKFGKPIDLPWAVVPIIVGGKIHGCIAADNALSKKPITGRDLRILSGLGGLISQVLQRQLQAEIEKQLRDSQSLYQSLIKNIPLAMWRKDTDFRFVWVNGLFCNTVGLEKSEIIGKTDYDIFERADADRYRRGDEHVAETKEQFKDAAEAFKVPGGKRRYIHVIKIPLFDSSGRFSGTQGMFLDVTDDKFRHLFEEAPIGFHEIDTHGKLTHVNKTEQDRLGYDFEEMRGRYIWEFVPNEDEETARKIFEPLLRGSERLQNDYALNFEAKDKSIIPTLLTNRISRDSEGKITGMMSVVRPVGTGVGIQETLQDPDPRYLIHVKELKLPVFIKNSDLKFEFVNEQFVRDCHGKTKAEIIGGTDIDLYGNNLGTKYQRDDRRVLDDGKVLDRLELHADPTKDDKTSVVQVIKFPIMDSVGRAVKVLGVFWEISNHESAKAELYKAFKKARAEYRNIIYDAVDGIFQSTLSGQFRSVNPALVRMLGYDTAEDLLKVENISEEIFYDPHQRDDYLKMMSIPEYRLIDFEYKVRRKDRTVIWLSESSRAVTGADDKVEYIEGFVQDITIRKALNREIQHRVRNILASIRGVLVLGRNKVQSEYRFDPVVSDIFAETEARLEAMKLVHQLLLEADDYKEVSIQGLLRRLIDSIAKSFGTKSEHIGFHIDVDNIKMDSGAATACALMVNDLISNSLKHAFTGRKDGAIWVALKKTEEPDQTMLSVADNGVGIPETTDLSSPKAFGLQLVKDFADSLHGEMTIDRVEGTKVSIKF